MYYDEEKFHKDIEQLKIRFEDDLEFGEACDNARSAAQDMFDLIDERDSCFNEEQRQGMTDQIESIRQTLLEFVKLCFVMMNNGPREVVV